VTTDPARTQPPLQRQAIRIEYLDYQSEADYREYRLAVHLAEGTEEVRLRVPIAAFSANRVLLQDGPDVCYQRLLRMLSAGEALSGGVITVDGAELAAYRASHTVSCTSCWTSRSSKSLATATSKTEPSSRKLLRLAPRS